MKSKNKLFKVVGLAFIYSWLISEQVLSQVLIDRQVISAYARSTSTSSSIDVTATAGEPVIGALDSELHFWTQGFQQPDDFDGITGTLVLNERSYNFQVFPNPAHEVLKVIFEDRLPDKMKLRLLDIYGRKVHEMDLSGHAIHEIDIPVSTIPSGIYSLIIQNGRHILTAEKINIIH